MATKHRTTVPSTASEIRYELVGADMNLYPAVYSRLQRELDDFET